MIIGQLTNTPASRANADAIDALLAGDAGLRRYDGPARDHLPAAWAECDLLVSHLALGATTRLIAPLLASKLTDPGVVVVDDAARFVIPLVGGHVGGANELARKIAGGLGATAVVTTATDVRDLPGLDTLGWATSGDLAAVTRAMIDGRPVELVREHPWPLPALPPNVAEAGVERVERRGSHVKVLPPPPPPVARIVVTDRASVPSAPGGDAADDGPGSQIPVVALHPASLIVGIGCNRGTSADAIDQLVRATLAGAGLTPASVAAITSVDAKAGEEGIRELAQRYQVPFVTYPADVLAAQDVPSPSAYAQAAVGTPSVSEASVLARGADLIVTKHKTPEATCAIGRLVQRGQLAVVGLGPGAEDLLTPRARQVLRDASMVVGYRPYVAQVRALLRPGTEISATGMGTEEARVRLAIDEARKGRRVAIVTSGDPGIYAMASPALQLGTEGIDVQIVPGVTAELAAAALLGAPLGNDHATLSLSDLHTPWEVIERRLAAAAEGDLVVSLYNPRSRKRVAHLPRALEILGAHRPPSTPVAVVRDATRPGQHIAVSTLASFDPQTVDMHSIVIVGSTTTRLVPTGDGGQFIMTPRDYTWMPEERP